MIDRSIDILILDAHGVVFNNPFASFLHRLATMTNQRGDDVLRRWREELRLPAWTGSISDDEIWHRLSGGQGDADCWQAILESCYSLGPLGDRLDDLPVNLPVWILSNHRTVWLDRRLRRFGLRQRFEQVIVSQDMGLAKPDVRLFQMVMQRIPASKRVLCIDDQMRNLKAASSVGMRSMGVDEVIKAQTKSR